MSLSWGVVPRWLRGHLILVCAATLIVFCMWRVAAVGEDAPDRASFPLEVDAKPAIGTIAGIKLSIPHHYMPRGVHYKGEELWKPRKAPLPPRTFASDIEDFGLLLRESNYQPVKTAQDWLDYQAFMRRGLPHPSENHWLIMDVIPSWYAGNNGSLKPIFERYMKELVEITHWGPFIPQDGEVYRLKRAVSQKPEKDKSSVVEPDELFYDPTTWSTFITCSNNHQKVPPFVPFSSCQHHFTVPDVQSVAKVGFDKEDLSHWAEREREIKKIISSFIVQ